MKSRFVRPPSPAMAISVAALFVALGGTSYAAFSLPAKSVGTTQLKKNAVTTSKIKRGAVTDSKIALNTITGDRINLSTLGTVPSATRASSADNATNASNAAHAASADTATFAAAPTTLPPGKTETGEVYLLSPDNGAGGNYMGASISFPFPLSSAPVAHYVTGPTAQCPGSVTNPTATPGNLCVYQVSISAGVGPGTQDETKYGAGVYGLLPSDTNYSFIVAVWAVTE